MDALATVCSRSTKFIMVWFGYGCAGNRKLSKHERYSGFDMDVLVTVCSRNTSVISGLSMDALVTVCSRSTKFIMVWFWYGCTGNRMLSKHERYSGFGMDALVCSRNTSVILV